MAHDKAYLIGENKSLVEGVPKKNIVDNLTSSDSDKVLSARQGKILKESINSLGINTNIKGNVDVFSDLPTGAEVADGYIVEADKHLYRWNGSVWVDLGYYDFDISGLGLSVVDGMLYYTFEPEGIEGEEDYGIE